jgi:hypothetical protein
MPWKASGMKMKTISMASDRSQQRRGVRQHVVDQEHPDREDAAERMQPAEREVAMSTQGLD